MEAMNQLQQQRMSGFHPPAPAFASSRVFGVRNHSRSEVGMSPAPMSPVGPFERSRPTGPMATATGPGPAGSPWPSTRLSSPASAASSSGSVGRFGPGPAPGPGPGPGVPGTEQQVMRETASVRVLRIVEVHSDDDTRDSSLAAAALSPASGGRPPSAARSGSAASASRNVLLSPEMAATATAAATAQTPVSRTSAEESLFNARKRGARLRCVAVALLAACAVVLVVSCTLRHAITLISDNCCAKKSRRLYVYV